MAHPRETPTPLPLRINHHPSFVISPTKLIVVLVVVSPPEELCNPLPLENLAAPLLLLGAETRHRDVRAARPLSLGSLSLEVLAIISYDGEDGPLKDLLHADPLLAAAFHILGTHLLGHGHALVRGDRSKALGLEHLDAGLLVAKVRLEAYKDERCVGTKVQNLRVPLNER